MFYPVRALYHHLEWRYHGVPWPSVTLPFIDVLDHMIKRINEASVSCNICILSMLYIYNVHAFQIGYVVQGPYQMFGVLGDVALIRSKYTHAT